MPLRPRLQIRLFDNDLSSPTLIDELTERVGALQFSTALNGGFKVCTFTLPATIGQAWLWLSREGKRGYHFNRITVHEDQTLVWEGRIMEVELLVQSGEQSIRVTAMGYWSACRDQFYTATGNTNWASGSHTIDDIIKEMLTEECPDISSDQTNITATSRDVVGLDLTTKAYPQARINELTSLSDSDGKIWFFAIWEGRKPYLKQRVSTTLHWTTYTSELGPGSLLQQDAYQLRNNILPVKDGTEGTAAADSDRRSTVPVRDLSITIQKGTPSGAENEERDRALAEKKAPQQSQRFIITGRIWSTKEDGAFIGTPLWRVRSGEVIRISDLIPATVATPTFDALRTFYINETSYDAITNRLTVVPDRPPTDITRLVTRSIQTELDR